MWTGTIKCPLRMIYYEVYLIKKLYKFVKRLKIVLKWQMKLKKLTLLTLHHIKLVKEIDFIDIKLSLNRHDAH